MRQPARTPDAGDDEIGFVPDVDTYAEHSGSTLLLPARFAEVFTDLDDAAAMSGARN